MSSNKGFASLTKGQRKFVSQKGGVAVQQKGTGHRLNGLTAKHAAMKGVASRLRKQSREAALVLLEAGLTPEQLFQLQLSEAELVYYGGSKRTKTKFNELLARVAALPPVEIAELGS